MGGTPGGLRKELSDDEKAQIEAERKLHEEKREAFINSLTEAQKALYEAMAPQIAKPAEGQPPAPPDKQEVQSMKEKQEAFIASLTEEQKTAYDELFPRPGSMPAQREHLLRNPGSGKEAYTSSI
jgi:hypothetical protein